MPSRLLVVRATIAVGMIAGIALSLPLWQTRSSYPRVPLLEFVPALPQPFDTVFLLLFATVLTVFVWRPPLRGLALAWCGAALFLMVQDQSRIQPWFLEYVLLLAAIAFSKSESAALNGCRLIVAVVYLWSGVHKMNTSFAEKLFPWLVAPIPIVGFTVPFVEIGIGAALLSSRLRQLGVIAAVAMHLLLLAALSPWALGWNGVIGPWNAALIILVPCLFWRSDVSLPVLLTWEQGTWIRKVVILFMLVLPLLSLVGLWDMSPGFALYSGNQLIGSVVLSADAWERRDDRLRSVASEHVGDRYRVFLDDWAVAATNVPAYPARRVLRQIAQTLCKPDMARKDLLFILEQPSQWLYRPGWHTIEDRETLCE